MDDEEKRRKNREAVRRYQQSEKGKARRREYRKEYYKRPEGKEITKEGVRRYVRANRQKVGERQKRWREANPERVRASQSRAERKYRAWYYDLKKGLSCSVCGESRPPCLDFHHRDPKEKLFNISSAAHRRLRDNPTREQILAEIEKCDVLCRNCHAMLHWENGGASCP